LKKTTQQQKKKAASTVKSASSAARKAAASKKSASKKALRTGTSQKTAAKTSSRRKAAATKRSPATKAPARKTKTKKKVAARKTPARATPAKARPKTSAKPASKSTRGASRKAAVAAPEAPQRLRLSSQRILQGPPPASEPANHAELRQILLAKREEVMQLYELDVRAGLKGGSSDGNEDIVDLANSAYNRELSFAISDNERELLEQIDAALARMDAGRFGACLSCGAQIASLRLRAIPWARYCIDCQELEERGLLRD
jgi:DnaK suppressor protein